MIYLIKVLNEEKGNFMENANEKKYRLSNFELLRIIAMLLIVFAHFAVHGIEHYSYSDAYELWKTGSVINQFFTASLNIGGDVGVALFFMISGFFLIRKEKASVIKVTLEGLFYGLFALILFGISYICGYKPVEIDTTNEIKWLLLAILNPMTGGSWWFLSSYVILMLFVPIINKALNRINKRGFFLFLLLGWIIFLIDSTLDGAYFSIERGLFFYLVGAFISLFVDKQKSQKKLPFYLMIILVLFLCAIFTSYYSMLFSLDSTTTSKVIVKILSITKISFLSIGIAISLFLIFYSFTFQNKIINRISSTMFGIYLIHESIIGRSVIWRGIFKMDNYYSSNLFPLYSVLIVLCVFLVCSAIDFIRQICFEKWAIKYTNKLIQGFKEKYFLDFKSNSIQSLPKANENLKN